ncbi:MAG: hypothetical protein LEGION0398_MBIBDBAK_00474 [Legionellaceae bacterium]
MVRGLDKKHEQDPRGLIRDTRTLGQRVSDFFKNPMYVSISLFVLGAGGFFIPTMADLILLIGIWIFSYAYTRKLTLPFRMPTCSGMLDYNDPLPGSDKPRKARGICFFGNAKDTNEELWFNNDDMRTHALIFGSTGSGKTEALISLAFNALIQGSGFIYVDGKGDNSLFTKIFSMARRMGREDDVLLINFMTGARDIVGPQEKRLSNTMNPFASGSSSMLSQLVVSLMDSGSSSDSGDMWKGRAIVFVEAIMKILVYMRDQGHILLDANTIRSYFELNKLEAIVMDKQFLRDNQEPIDISDIPQGSVDPIYNYVINLPGYDRAKKGRQVSQVLEQHGYITMQLTRVFGSLADTYGHIIRTNLPEVDIKDVVLNRRILVVLLPALEKSPDELANLGKVIIASLKAMMAAGLGDEVEGTYRDIIERKPTNAPTPFICILDEYGYYAVKGFSVVPAQARSLGFSAIFAGQDLPAFQKASKEEAASIGANTNIKICMKLEDPLETWDFFNKTAGEAYVTKVDAFQTQAGSVLNSYLDTRSSSAEKRARIDLLDLKDQREGEAHIFFKSRIIRAKLFYAQPKTVAKIRLNQLLKVEPIAARKLIEMNNRLARFYEIVQNKSYLKHIVVDDEDITVIANLLNENNSLPSIERSISALLGFNKQDVKNEEEFEEENAIPTTELNIFCPLRLSDYLKETILIRNLEEFSQPLITKANSKEYSAVIERLSGRLEKHATNIAKEIVQDLELATFYPVYVEVTDTTIDNITNDIKKLIEKIQDKRQSTE